jgi:tRNA pseudouridine65 synthase
MTEPLALLYADDDLVAVHKPSGLFVHRTDLDRSVEDCALQRTRDALGGGFLYPVHRLDRGTSGLLVFARSPEAQRFLAAQFAARLVRKSYLAIVRGWPQVEARIDAPLARLDADGVPRRDEPAQEAETCYRRLATVELPVAVDRYPTSRYALLSVEPRSGRRHQIRRHLRKLGHPLIGDTTYGNATHNRFFRTHFGIHRLLLAATALEIRRPTTGEPLALTAPLADDFLGVASALGWRAAIVDSGAVTAAPVY